MNRFDGIDPLKFMNIKRKSIDKTCLVLCDESLFLAIFFHLSVIKNDKLFRILFRNLIFDKDENIHFDSK